MPADGNAPTAADQIRGGETALMLWEVALPVAGTVVGAPCRCSARAPQRWSRRQIQRGKPVRFRRQDRHASQDRRQAYPANCNRRQCCTALQTHAAGHQKPASPPLPLEMRMCLQRLASAANRSAGVSGVVASKRQTASVEIKEYRLYQTGRISERPCCQE